MVGERPVILDKTWDIYTKDCESNDEGCVRKEMCSAFVDDLDNKSETDKEDEGKLF